MKNRIIPISLAIALVLSMGLVSCGGGITIPLKNPDSFVQMMPAEIDSLDPAWGYDTPTCEQIQYIYETLLFYEGEETDQFVPVLATEWNASEDGTRIRLKIRQGVKFHEGGDLTPEDVEYSFERAMVQDRRDGPMWTLYQPLLGLYGSRDGDGSIQVTFDQIDNAVEVDGDWVQFNLVATYPTLTFYQILCGTWGSIVDKEWCVANGEWDGTEQTWQDYNNLAKADSYLYDHASGTGPWKLEEWDPGVQVELVKNDDYWREPAAFERIITKFVPEWATRMAALLAGDADLVRTPLPVPSINFSEFLDIEVLEGFVDLNIYHNLPTLQSEAFFFNMNISNNSSYVGSGVLDGEGIPTDFFTNVDVRKGFCYVFDYETFIEECWLGEAQQLGSPVCEGLPYFNANASRYSHDLAKVEEHLKLAWGGEVWAKGFKFTLPYGLNNAKLRTAYEILAENLVKINPKFQVSLVPIASGTYINKMLGTRDMPMFLLGWQPDYPHPDNLVSPFMHSNSFFAEAQGYGYPELDQLIEEAFKEVDPAVQQDMYYELQERYYQDAPSIVLGQPLGNRYFTKYIHGFYFNPMFAGQAGPLYYMHKSLS